MERKTLLAVENGEFVREIEGRRYRGPRGGISQSQGFEVSRRLVSRERVGNDYVLTFDGTIEDGGIVFPIATSFVRIPANMARLIVAQVG